MQPLPYKIPTKPYGTGDELWDVGPGDTGLDRSGLAIAEARSQCMQANDQKLVPPYFESNN